MLKERIVTEWPKESQLPTSNDKETEGQSFFEAQDCVNSSVLPVCNVVTRDSVVSNEEVVDNSNVRLEFEEVGFFSNLERPDNFPQSDFPSGCRTRKFQPKLKVVSGKETSETINMDGSIPTFPSDDVLDQSSMSFSDLISPGPLTSGLPNEEQINLAEVSHSSDPNVLLQEELPGETIKEIFKSRKRKSSSVLSPSQKSGHSSLDGDMGGNDKSSRQLRKRTPAPQLRDEPEDEAHANNEDAAEMASQKKRASENPKKPEAEKGKRVQRQTSKNDASEKSAQKAHKKFSHSTRRKNRLKDLLCMPEEEIDFQILPVRDILLFSEYKERLAIKEAKASKNSSINQSAAKSSNVEDSYNEEDTVTSEPENDQSKALFNYHSFMDKTPKARWSKQDTELFYEGLQQFGTDLSMIQQLFPGRTRHQIKLKYKKEERQHPLRLSESLSNRAKDHSHFEKVIEQLQQAATQAEQESNRDVSAGLIDEEAEEAELNPKTNEEVTKPEQEENETVKAEYANVNEVHSPPKYEEDVDDDADLWSSYKSVF
ncbi:uncharacterized protein LOC126681079 [Mercurialis annua]|uniref:uncharacterized protein LOC126681079 n=1 Tax=Mercurialis annua TaxID=3986 RepID=UPI00215EAEC1|nr:uncharacterized protein LOC126681079 [Mercurialis annua]